MSPLGSLFLLTISISIFKMFELKRSSSSSSRLLSAAAARSVEEPVVYRVTPASPPQRYPLQRAFSVSELNTVPSKTAATYSPFFNPIFSSYHRDWDLGNDYRHAEPRHDLAEKRHFSIGWPPYSRYHSDYPDSFYPSSYRHHQSSSLENPTRTRNVDYFDSFYWKGRLDPYSVRSFPGRQYAPWSFRPRIYDTMDASTAARLYRQGLLGYDTFEKYWIKPTGWYNHYVGRL